MVLHGYERTGIKENKQLKESKEQMLKKKRQQENLQIIKDRTTYNQDVAKKYDTSLMNRDKECKKIKKLLGDYYEASFMSKEENIFQLVSGYQEYLLAFGDHMTALELRTFRNSIVKTLSISEEQLFLAKQSEASMEVLGDNPQDEAILDFCVENLESLTTKGLNSLELVGFLLDAGTPIQNSENLKEVKTKVMNLLADSKSKK